MMFYGEKLSSLRELNGLSRKELADKLNISEQAVWQYENDSTIPRIEVLNQLRNLFCVETRYFSPLDILQLKLVKKELHIGQKIGLLEKRQNLNLLF